MSLYSRIRIVYNDNSSTGVLQMFADSFDRLKDKVKDTDLPAITKA